MKSARGPGAHHEHNGDDDDDGEVLEWLDGGEQRWRREVPRRQHVTVMMKL